MGANKFFLTFLSLSYFIAFFAFKQKDPFRLIRFSWKLSDFQLINQRTCVHLIVCLAIDVIKLFQSILRFAGEQTLQPTASLTNRNKIALCWQLYQLLVRANRQSLFRICMSRIAFVESSTLPIDAKDFSYKTHESMVVR